MTKYIIKRLLLAVLTVFIICAITFFLMHAIPGGPFNREKALDPATIAALNARYNLDKPLVVQFGIYIKELFKGDFGVSLKNGREISSIISESFPISCKVGLRAISIALICGIRQHCRAHAQQMAGSRHSIPFYSVYGSTELCIGNPVVACILYKAGLGTRLEP